MNLRHMAASVLAVGLFAAGCASAPENAVGANQGSTVNEKTDERAGLSNDPNGDTKDRSDIAETGTGSAQTTDRGALHPCTSSEAAIADSHCTKNHHSLLGCHITGCMSNGSMIYYSWID